MAPQEPNEVVAIDNACQFERSNVAKSGELRPVVDAYPRVHTGAILEQQLHDSGVSIQDCAVQVAVPIAMRVDVGARRDQQRSGL